MNRMVEYLSRRFYSKSVHPYRIFESQIESLVRSDSVVLDAGCGRTAPVLQRLTGQAARLIGVDLVDFVDKLDNIELINSDLSSLPIADGEVDVIISRSVFEHLENPLDVYSEFARVLKPGGVVIFLTASIWDYATTIARMVPNRYHAWIVSRVEGRAENDVFPTFYRTNSRRSIERLCSGSGLKLVELRYLSQYPNYFMFSSVMFLLGTCYEKMISSFDFFSPLRGWMLVTLRK